MDIRRGDVVCSRAGHDKGDLLCVVDAEGEFLFLADGKRRRVETPKRKRSRHVRWEATPSHPVFLRIQAGETAGNNEIRRALAAFRDERNQDSSQGGNDAWRKTI